MIVLSRVARSRRCSRAAQVLTIASDASGQIAKGMTSDLETRPRTRRLLADLDEIMRNKRRADGQDLATWLTATIAEYEQWLARIHGRNSFR